MGQQREPLLTRRLVVATPLLFCASGAAAAERPQHLARRLREHCAMLARTSGLSGAVLLAQGDRIAFQSAYGLRNRAENLPNRLDTRFNIASIGKLFTSLAIMRLAEAGRIGLEQTLAQAWPAYPNRAVAERVTLAQILTHTAGLGNAILFKPKAGFTSHTTQTDCLSLFVDDPLEGEPGTFAYSNDGYVLLGALIEHLSGQSFRRHCRETIFTPLGMRNTDFLPLREISPNLSLPYVRDLEQPGAWIEAPQDDMPPSAAGGARSTVEDLLRFATALRESRLLNAEMTRAWTAPRVAMGRRARYGYGVEVDRVNGHPITGHSGGHFGVACELMIFEDQDLIFVALTNGEVDPFWDLANFIKTAVAGESDASLDYAFTLRLTEVIKAQGGDAGAALVVTNPERRAREGVIDTIGFREWHGGDARAAEALLTFNRTAFPQSLSALWSTAEFYRLAGRRAEAIAAYREFLVQQPGDEDAERYIARLSRG